MTLVSTPSIGDFGTIAPLYAHLGRDQRLPQGPSCRRLPLEWEPLHPLGTQRIALRGVEIEIAIQHYSFWMLGRVQSHYDGLDGDDKKRAGILLAESGLSPLMGARPRMRLGRRNFQEVFV